MNKENIHIPDWDEWFFKHVYLVASKSKDRYTKIGTVIVDGRTVISEGYNGLASGVNDDIDSRHERPEKYFWYSHSERNAIFHCARRGIKTEKTTLMTLGLPCCDCADAIINSGIKKIIIHKEWQDVWDKITHNKWKESQIRSTEKFKEAGVTVELYKKFLNEKCLISGDIFVL